MSFLGGLFGVSSPQPEKEASASADLFGSANIRSNVVQAPAPVADGTLPQAPAAPPATPAPSSLDLLSSSFDAAKLHPMADLGDKLDFLALDEDKLTEVQGAASVLPSRGWTDDLCVGTGTTYLSGLGIGGLWGMKEGLSRPLGPNASMRLRLNSVLNSCTRRGSFTGNSLGVLAIFYNLSNSSLDAVRNKHDALNSMAAGALSGGIYKCTAGVRPMLVGAALGTAAMGTWSFVKTLV
ncbi:Mitochondrial import inner membrane translocase subunit tim23 [Vanrija albida]|uniref:Mitochondrial import inner membrane translocase subunit tim23 n=1 Tax=Vanrija albida TaxID=181172 RepID=A0ABR3Q232_9TREE